MRRSHLVALLALAAAVWVGRWALLEVASYLHRTRVPDAPLPIDSPHPPGRMPASGDA